MDGLKRLTEVMNGLVRPGRWQLKAAIEACLMTVDDLEPILAPPSVYPYGRQVLCRTEHSEVLVMSWAPQRECAPHDHGQSWGWLSVLEGVVTHAVYQVSGDNLPVLRKRVRKEVGATLFAPKGLVHSMGNPGHHRLVTLHAYAPPITGMRVYDLRHCAACVVSDDCGAWWPDSQRQIVQRLRLGGTKGSHRATS